MTLKLPTEILDKIFQENISPKNVRYFGKYMSKKTKTKLSNCNSVIKTNNLSEVKRLKFIGGECSHEDLMYALKKGYYKVVEYINKEYPKAKITYNDIYGAVINQSPEILKILLTYYDGPLNMEKYIQLFGANQRGDKKKVRILLDFKPVKRPLRLGEIFMEPMNMFIPDFSGYVKTIVKIGQGDIIIDDQFIRYCISIGEAELLNSLFGILLN